MADLMKRVHYFDHQFLRVEDFTCEQEYHMARRRLHNRVLHTPGIAEGLEVEYDQDNSEVTIGPGTAINSEGQEIVLTKVQRQALPDCKEGQKYWLTIAYHEEPTDPTEETGVKGDTRWTETPDIKWLKKPGQKVVLAQVRRSDDKVTVDNSEKVRTVAGAKLGDTTATKLTLRRDGVDSEWPALSCSEANQVDLSGSLSVSGDANLGGTLTVSGNVGIGTTSPEATLDVNGDLRVSGPLYAPSSLGTYCDEVEKWQNDTTSRQWTLLTKREITLSARTHVLVLGHCHGITSDGHTALDLGIFIDGYDPPDVKAVRGVGLTHSTTWVPMVTVTAAVLDKGDHTIELKFRSRGGHSVSCSGVSMTTMVLGSAL